MSPLIAFILVVLSIALRTAWITAIVYLVLMCFAVSVNFFLLWVICGLAWENL